MEREKRNKQNYLNFALTLFAIMALIFVVGVIGAIGYTDGAQEGLEPYERGRLVGRSLRHFIDYFVQNGLAFGSLFAVLASLEKNKSFRWALLHAFLGWAYVIFYALTRKIIRTGQC